MRFRTMVGTTGAAALLLCATQPAPAAAQLSITGGCETAACSTLRIFLEATAAPLNLFELTLTLNGPATFAPIGSVSYLAWDDFGPFSDFATVTASTLFFDFASVGWLELNTPFTETPGRLEVAVGLLSDGPAPFSFVAVDAFDGEVIGDGVFRVFDASVVPEPMSLVLLGTGLAGLAAMRRRRRGRDAA